MDWSFLNTFELLLPFKSRAVLYFPLLPSLHESFSSFDGGREAAGGTEVPLQAATWLWRLRRQIHSLRAHSIVFHQK